MAPAKQLKQAANGFAQDPINRFVWGSSGKSLQAVYGADGRVDVLFTCRNGKLNASCDCRGDLSRPCLHVLIAMMVIARVMQGSKFHVTDLPAARVEQFREELKMPAEEAEPAKVIFSQESAGAPYRIDYDSGEPGPSWLSMGAPTGMEWLEWQMRAPEKVAAGFLQWLQSGQSGVQLELRPAPGDTPLFDLGGFTSTKAKAHEQCRLGEQGVTIERTLRGPKQERLNPFIDLGYGLAFCYEKGCFASMDAPDSVVTRQASSLSLEAFHRARLRPDERRQTVDMEGKAQIPAEETSRPALFAEIEGEQVTLRARALLPDEALVPIHSALAETLSDLRNNSPYALLLRHPTRRRRFVELIGHALSAPTDRQRLVAECPDDPAFDGREMHGREASRCLEEVTELLAQWDAPWLVAAPAQEPIWRSCAGAGGAVGRVMVLLQRLFASWDPFQSPDLTNRVEVGPFGRRLGLLAAACEVESIVLRLDGEPVRSSHLDLSLDIVRSGELDWFELHPEVRAGSMQLTSEQWLAVVRSGFYRTESGGFVAVNPESLEALEMMARRLEGQEQTHRLQLFDWLALRIAGVQCRLPAEDEAVLQSLQSMEKIPSRPLPNGLQADLREYQRHGYEWLAFLYEHRFGACLADDMGLGKTVQAIALLLAVQEDLLPQPTFNGPHLIVLPPTLLFNWHHELERFAPSLRVLEYVGANRSAEFDNVDVVLTTYELVRRDQDLLAEKTFGLAIFDEAQAVKNPKSRRAQALTRLRASFRLCLTGTPLENHFREFHSIMEAAVPGLFGDAKPGAYDEPPDYLVERTRPFLLRRTKEKILSDLPPKVESDTWLELGDRQKECYTRAVGEVRKEILEAYQEKPAQQAGIVALSALMRLRQICVSPALIAPDLPDESPKLDLLTEHLVELQDEGHATLVFSNFVKALDLLATRLEGVGLQFLRMHGSVPTKKRRGLVEQFQDPNGPGIFLISTKTGGVGLNLTRASYVYHLDPWWNPAVENQASDRAHRLGQQQSVFIQRLLMRHSVEEKIAQLKQRKRALFDAVVSPEGAESASETGAASLTVDDFRFLLE